MDKSKEIYKKWKANIYGFIVLLIVQTIAFLMARVLVREFIDKEKVASILLLVLGIFLITTVINYLVNRVIILRYLLTTKPVKCTIQDFLLVGETIDHKTKYTPYPILKSIEDQKLYLAYGDNSLVNFYSIFDYSDPNNIYFKLYRRDKSQIKISDPAEMYILKNVKIKISIDVDKNIIKIKGKKIYFRHFNPTISIEDFEDIIFYKGAVDIDL